MIWQQAIFLPRFSGNAKQQVKMKMKVDLYNKQDEKWHEMHTISECLICIIAYATENSSLFYTLVLTIFTPSLCRKCTHMKYFALFGGIQKEEN